MLTLLDKNQKPICDVDLAISRAPTPTHPGEGSLVGPIGKLEELAWAQADCFMRIDGTLYGLTIDAVHKGRARVDIATIRP